MAGADFASSRAAQLVALATPGARASAGRRGRGALLGALILCLGWGHLLLAFTGAAQGGVRPTALELQRAGVSQRAAAPEGKAASGEDEAARTRGIFMSLDTEEFGLDSDEPAKIEEPKEETWFDKAGDGASSIAAVAIFTIVIVGVTFYTFFTRQAEDNFYYSGMRDRASRFGAEEVGVDFREFDNGTVRSLQKAQGEKP
mmetsp:Transcript_97018/g.313284  ORF Transcript_97018/g.313284 Transcript_97018/m.313284 type:complete len:201 (+) Transcript_97018:54-656(+)